ncbi:MAG: ATP-binding protein [Bacteroidales bacterium]|nr:ATP-binding protein [Bacteroidales bacterium]
MMYGGMPLSVIEKDELEKKKYLLSLHNNVFVKDITERYNLKDDVLLSSLIDILYSSVGSLTNTHKLANTAESVMKIKSSDNTIKKYLDYLEDAFLFRSAKRYDIKGKRYFGTNLKYYATDIGLRNAKLNFRQYERSHLMENIIYNELIIKGYSVDIGIVEVTRKIEDRNVQSQHEIDFIVNNGSNKIYIQSSLNVDTEEKRQQEIFSLKRSGDFYKKIVVLYGNQKPVYDEHGILYIGIIPFIFSMENILN